MQLNHKIFGQGDPLIILHGLFGMLDNWQTLAKKFAENYTVILVDLRNHGKSPHVDDIDYPLMAADVNQFLEDNWIYEAHILGHSMGGKVAMQFAMDYPEIMRKLVVVDMGIKKYPSGHGEIFDAMLSLDILNIGSRSAAQEHLMSKIDNLGVVQFLMKNLARDKETGGFRWKMNLKALHEHYEKILSPIEGTEFDGEALFLRGGASRYVLDEDWNSIQELFPNSKLATIDDAGHWVHAVAPKELFEIVSEFLAD